MPQLSYWHYVTSNKSAIQKSKSCGCIYCKKIFNANLVTDFTSDKSALCPFCFIDAIVPDYLTTFNNSSLNQWHQEGFK